MRHLPRLFVAAAALATTVLPAQTISPDGHPRNGEVPLPAAGGWNAFLVHDAGIGIWTVKSFQVFDQYGCPEIVGLDEEGRCTVLVSYSGKWTPNDSVRDGRWLAPVGHADVDPRHEGKELYAGGQSGNVYRIHLDEKGELKSKQIAHFPEEEIHTVVADDVRPERPGAELLIFLKSGGFFELVPQEDGEEFDVVELGDTGGRVRDAIVMDMPADGTGPWIVTVSRAREVARIRLDPDGYDREVLLREPMGFGRVCRGKGRFEDVLYVTRDDGLVLRLTPQADGSYAREAVYAGPQGLRGVVAGRFTADPNEECLAVFGYSAKVQLLTRKGDAPWKAETIFVERDRGHWLAIAEVDGRNDTDEIIASGYAGRIVLLARPAGFGFEGLATDPDDRAAAEDGGEGEPAEQDAATTPATKTVAICGQQFQLQNLQPLSYRGGFESKTAVYETLVTRDPETGALAPGLASTWRVSDDGLTTDFILRGGARFHDGQPVDAAAVVAHFKRWVGLPEHAWLRSSDRIVSVEALSEQAVRIRTDRPVALLPDLCAINPCAIRGPGALNSEGTFVRPVGSGPYRVQGLDEAGRTLRLARTETGEPVDLIAVPDAGAALDGLAAGEIDVVAGSYLMDIDPRRAQQLAKDPRFTLTTAPGSAVRYLSFSRPRNDTSSAMLRRRIAAAIDREALVRDVAAGLADPCTTWAAPSVTAWVGGSAAGLESAASQPIAATAHRRTGREILGETLRLLAEPADRKLAQAVAAQLVSAGIPTVVEVPDAETFAARRSAADYDLLLEHTWGVPYDPYLSLVARFATPPEGATAASDRSHGVHQALRELVDRVVATAREDQRIDLYRQIQACMDEHALIVPLYAPRRIEMRRADLPELPLTHDLYRTL